MHISEESEQASPTLNLLFQSTIREISNIYRIAQPQTFKLQQEAVILLTN